MQAFSLTRVNPVVRAIIVIGAVASLVTGITFAALTSQATLTNNTITSASAELQVNNTDDTANGLGATDNGFAFSGVVPGGADSNVGNFQLKNNGTAGLNVSLNLDGAPAWTVLPSGSVNNSKVKLVVSCTAGAVTFGATDTVTNFVAGPVALAGGSLAAGETATCTAKVQMLADAFSGTSASSDQFDLVFTGTGV